MRCEAQIARFWLLRRRVSQSLRAHSQTRKHWGREWEKTRSVIYSTDRKNEANKMFIIFHTFLPTPSPCLCLTQKRKKTKTKQKKIYYTHDSLYYYMAESVFAMRLVNLRSVTCSTDQNFKENAHFGALNLFEHSFIDRLLVITERGIPSARLLSLSSRLCPSTVQRMLGKYIIQFLQRLFQVRQN